MNETKHQEIEANEYPSWYELINKEGDRTPVEHVLVHCIATLWSHRNYWDREPREIYAHQVTGARGLNKLGASETRIESLMRSKELTIEHFAASLLWIVQSENKYTVRWLCSSDEHKRERLVALREAFEEWKDEELRRERRIQALPPLE